MPATIYPESVSPELACPLAFEFCDKSCLWWSGECLYCSKLDFCQQVAGVLDKDLPADKHYERVIREMCRGCGERREKMEKDKLVSILEEWRGCHEKMDIFKVAEEIRESIARELVTAFNKWADNLILDYLSYPKLSSVSNLQLYGKVDALQSAKENLARIVRETLPQ
mgnify:FL=1